MKTCPVRLFLVATLCLVGGVARAEKWALVVGVENYEVAGYFSRFHAADNDARKIKRVFIEALGVPARNVTLLVSDSDRKPTRANMVEEMGALAENIKPGDDILMFYAGNAFVHDGTVYLTPFDFRGKNTFQALETALPLSRLQYLLQKNKPRTLTVFLETGIRPGAPKLDLTPEPPNPGTIVSGGWEAPLSGVTSVTVFSSARPKRPSFFDDQSERGFFSLCLEKGLRGEAKDDAGNVNISSLTKYLQANLPIETTRRMGTAQNPTVTRSGKNAEITLKESTR